MELCKSHYVYFYDKLYERRAVALAQFIAEHKLYGVWLHYGDDECWEMALYASDDVGWAHFRRKPYGRVV